MIFGPGYIWFVNVGNFMDPIFLRNGLLFVVSVSSVDIPWILWEVLTPKTEVFTYFKCMDMANVRGKTIPKTSENKVQDSSF